MPSTMPESTGPLVSVIMPTYDDVEYISRALRSVAKQTYTNLEVVVVDSSGVNWLEELVGKLDWGQYYHMPPNGVAAARNRGIEAAEGAIIMFLDADDCYNSEKLERQVSILQGAADVVYSNVTVVRKNGTQTELSALPVKNSETHHIDFFRTGQGVPTVTLATWRECLEDERFREDLEAREDPHLWVRLFRVCRPVKIPEPTAIKYCRDDSLTSDPDMMYRSEMAEVASLLDRFEELRPYHEERIRAAQYRYGKQLFRAGHVQQARKVILDIMRSGTINHRTLALFVTALLPLWNGRVYRMLEQLNEARLRILRN